VTRRTVSGRTLLGAVSVTGVILLVVAGIWVAGSPASARKERADELRLGRLSELHYQLESHVANHGSLPESLRELEGEFTSLYDPRKDPVTGRAFEYRKLEERRYQVCAVFAAASDEDEPAYTDFNLSSTHGAGRDCFTRQVRPPDRPFPHGGS
jgi:hypothetical protein